MHDDQPAISDPSPPTLNHVIGQKQAVQQLRVALDAYYNDRAQSPNGDSALCHVCLCGPPGTGKTKLASMMASQLAEGSINIESLNGRNLMIDHVRNWQDSGRFIRPLFGKFDVKIVNELDAVPAESRDLLLTYFDEIPNGTVFIGTSNYVEKFEERFKSRLQRLPVDVPSSEQISALLRRWQLPESKIKKIVAESNGNVRDALLGAQTFLDEQLVNGVAEP